MFIHIYIYVYTYIHTHTYIYTYTYIYMYIHAASACGSQLPKSSDIATSRQCGGLGMSKSQWAKFLGQTLTQLTFADTCYIGLQIQGARLSSVRNNKNPATKPSFPSVSLGAKTTTALGTTPKEAYPRKKPCRRQAGETHQMTPGCTFSLWIQKNK